MRRLLNVSRNRQQELQSIYPWLHSVHEKEDTDVQMLFVSVFDHWLTREEACDLLERVPPNEQSRRDVLHANFCARVVRETETLYFIFRRRHQNLLVFRRFTSNAPLLAYCTPHGGRTLGHRQFHVALPELRCAFYEHWDDTNIFYFTDSIGMQRIAEWASDCGLHILKSSKSK